MRGRLECVRDDHPKRVGDVRGLGPMLAMEIVEDSESRAPSMQGASRITAETLKRGVITIRAGLYSNCVRFLPPLTIADAQIDEAMDVVAEAVNAAFSSGPEPGA